MSPALAWPLSERTWLGGLFANWGYAMPDADSRKPAFKGANLERSREDVLRAARPLPPDDEVLIEDLTEHENRVFFDVILNA